MVNGRRETLHVFVMDRADRPVYLSTAPDKNLGRKRRSSGDRCLEKKGKLPRVARRSREIFSAMKMIKGQHCIQHAGYLDTISP